MSLLSTGAPKIVKWYDGPEAFHTYCSNPEVQRAHMEGAVKYTTDWGGVNYSGALRDLVYGSVDRAQLAERLFNEVVEATMDTLGRNALVSSIVGDVPNVPAMLAGLPNSMFTRGIVDQKAQNAPIRIIVDVFASHMITQQQYIRRGVAALAFTMVMNTIRPIDLYVAITGSSMYIPRSAVAHVIKIDTKPLDLPRAVWMLSDPAFFRRLGFCSILHELRPYQHPTKKRDYLEDTIPCTSEDNAKWLRLEPEDVFIERLLYGDVLAVTSPIQWVNNMIKQHMSDIELKEMVE